MNRLLTRPLPALRASLHLLVAGLLALAITRSFPDGNATVVVPAAVVMGGVYALGALLARRRPSRSQAWWWLAVLMVSWVVVLLGTRDGVWLAFPLFLLQLHLLPPRAGVLAVVATTAMAVAGFAVHQGSVTAAAVIGPTLGAALAIVVVFGYQAIYRESEHRRELVEELTATRAELGAAEHARGVAAERERLAREIHDTLAQGLSSIQLLLRAAGRALPEQTAAAAGYVEQARATAQDNLAEARRFVRALTPPDLAGGSLSVALDRLCDTVHRASGLTAQLHTSGDPVSIPTPYEVALLRVAQSGLANAVQHSGAGRADLTLSFMEDRIALDIVDDGAGFDPSSVPTAGSGDAGFGLAAMRSRVRELGGTLEVESAHGQGTALAVIFPRHTEEGTTSP